MGRATACCNRGYAYGYTDITHTLANEEVSSDVNTETTTLREARRRAGLGRVKCASLAGIDAPSLARYETGTVQPGLIRALKIARVLGVRADEVAEFLPALREAQDAGLALTINGCEEEQE